MTSVRIVGVFRFCVFNFMGGGGWEVVSLLINFAVSFELFRVRAREVGAV